MSMAERPPRESIEELKKGIDDTTVEMEIPPFAIDEVEADAMHVASPIEGADVLKPAGDDTWRERKSALNLVIEKAKDVSRSVGSEVRNAGGLAGDIARSGLQRGSEGFKRMEKYLLRRGGELKDSFVSNAKEIGTGIADIGAHEALRVGIGAKMVSEAFSEKISRGVQKSRDMVGSVSEATSEQLGDTRETAIIGVELLRERARAWISGKKESFQNSLISATEVAGAIGSHTGDKAEALGNAVLSLPGEVDEWARRIGEMYNSVGKYKKLAVGVGMGAGAFLTVGVPVLPSIFVAGVIAQRALGFTGMYVHAENLAKRMGARSVEKRESGQKAKLYERLFEGSEAKQKAIAATLATAYSLGMSAAVGTVLHEAMNSGAGEAVRHWFGSVWSELSHAGREAIASVGERVGETVRDVGASIDAHVLHPLADAAHNLNETIQGDILHPSTHPYIAPQEVTHPAPLEVAPDMPPYHSVPVSSRGAEHAFKQIARQVAGDGHQYPAGSPMDILQHAAADPRTLDAEVHKLAIKMNLFDTRTGLSAAVPDGAVVNTYADGTLKVSEVLPTYTGAPEAPLSGVSVAPAETIIPEGEVPTATPPVGEAITAPEPQSASLDAGLAPHEPTAPEAGTAGPEQLPGAEQSLATTPEAGSPASEPVDTIVVNGIRVIPGEAHVYVDSQNHPLVYGGSAEERAQVIGEFLRENPKAIIYGPDADGNHRIPYFINEKGVIDVDRPLRSRGFLGFFKSYLKAPDPKEFAGRIK